MLKPYVCKVVVEKAALHGEGKGSRKLCMKELKRES
jgi:hypothetical protein